MFRYGKHLAPGANRWPRAAWITYLVALLMIAGTVSVGAEEEGRVGSEKAPAAATAAVTLAADDITTVDLTTLTPTDLVDTLTGSSPGLTTSNISYTGAAVAGGTFSSGPFGLGSGVILSSGDVANVIGPNTEDGVTRNNGLPGDSDLDGLIPGFSTFDATVLEFDFECATDEGFSFDYVFASDEYNEYTNTQFNDVFGFFFDAGNIALLPGTSTPVAINNVNGGGPVFGTNPSNPTLFNNNDLQDGGPFFNTEADGFVDVLTAGVAGLSPGPHTIRLAIADAGDRVLDSWVMIEGGSFQCVPPNEPPVADANGPYVGTPGVALMFDGTGSYDPDGDPIVYDWDYGDGTLAADVGATPSHTYATAGTYTVCLTVTDPGGLSDTNCTTATLNTAPVADPNGPYLLDINHVMFDGTGSYDPDGDPIVYDWDYGDGTLAADVGATPAHTYADPGIYEVCLTVTDPGFLSDTACTDAVIYDPAGGFVTGGGWIDSPAGAYYPQDLPLYAGSYYELFSAPGIPWEQANTLVSEIDNPVCAYPHLATPTTAEEDLFIVDTFGTDALFGKWLGGIQAPDGIEPDGGWGWVTGEPWVYTNWNTDEPNDVGEFGEDHLEYWDNGTWNDEGFLPLVTGYLVEYDDCFLPEGKANFGFVSKYKKGANVPTGNTEFQFHAGDLNFHSTSYDWLVVTGNGTAKFKGVGTINGEGAYHFQLWAGDGTGTDGADTFRIKIWYEDGGSEIVVYDNGMHQNISGGSIIVHTKK